MLLDSEDDIEVVGEAGDGEAVQLVRRELPAVALVDIRMPGLDGLAATRAITDDPDLSGVRVLSSSVSRRLIAGFRSRPSRGEVSSAALAELTDRERAAVVLVAQGLLNEEIAPDWVVSPATVHTHVSRAMMKLRARDRAQLVVIAYQNGLVHTG